MNIMKRYKINKLIQVSKEASVKVVYKSNRIVIIIINYYNYYFNKN